MGPERAKEYCICTVEMLNKKFNDNDKYVEGESLFGIKIGDSIKNYKLCLVSIYLSLGLKTKQIPLLQYLLPVGFGPSLKICP